MAQPQQFIMKYTGSASVQKGKAYTGTDMSSSGNVLQMKTEKVSVSISGNPMFLTTFGDLSYLDDTATYIFDKDCIVAVGEMVEVT